MSETITHIEKKKALVPELRFKEFDGIWVEKKLGELIHISSASRVHKEEWNEEGVPFFRSSDVVAAFNGTKNTKAFIPFDLYESLTKKIGRVQKDDILITGGGSIGIPYLIKNNDPLYFKDADLLWLKKNERINGYFLYNFFLTPWFKNYLRGISHIGTIAHYTVIQAKNTPFRFPSVEEQQKIASFLSIVDQKIQMLTRKKELLEQYKKGVMQQLFSQQIRFKDADGKEFPGWEDVPLGDCLDYMQPTKFLVNSTEYDDSFKTPVLTAGKTFVLGYTNETENICRDYPLIIFDDFTTASKFVDFPFKAKSSAMKLLTAKQNVDIRFIYEVMQKVKFEIGGHGRHWISIYSQLVVSVPSYSEQQKISRFIEVVDNRIKKVTEQLINTQVFKKGLLQKMFV